jgi:(p)ppGpp synthase/HD superfamily hydrolase
LQVCFEFAVKKKDSMMNIDLLNSYLEDSLISKETSVEECARQLAVRAHRDQTRWNGDAYVTHPIRVAAEFLGSPKAVSYLHDIVEDTDLTLDDLREFGFDKDIVDAVDSVTKREGENYLDFILRAKQNEIGCFVKIADIKDNLRDLDGKRNKTMRDKYELALWILENLVWTQENYKSK